MNWNERIQRFPTCMPVPIASGICPATQKRRSSTPSQEHYREREPLFPSRIMHAHFQRAQSPHIETQQQQIATLSQPGCMSIIAEAHSNARCSIRNTEFILFLFLSFFTHPAERQVTCKTNNHKSNLHSFGSLLRLYLNRSLPLFASNRLALSRSLEGSTAIIEC